MVYVFQNISVSRGNGGRACYYLQLKKTVEEELLFIVMHLIYIEFICCIG